jgi:predicted transcriptional regulator
MHTYVRTLQTISSRYAPSRILSFDIAHIFKALQIIEDRGHASRTLLCQELNLGEGAVRTLIKHLKMKELIETSNAGTKMSDKGKKFFAEILTCLPKGCSLPKCSIALGKYNYVVLLKQFSFAVKSGIEQRDASIKMGALGATTLLFSKGRFVMPNTNIMLDPLEKESSIYELLIKKLEPVEGDVIIIGSDDINRQTAELAAKNAALLTLINHKRHTK